MLLFVGTCNALRTASLTQTDLSLDLEGYHPPPPPPPPLHHSPPVYVLFISPMKIKVLKLHWEGWRQWWVVGYLFLTPVKSRHLVGGMGEGGGGRGGTTRRDDIHLRQGKEFLLKYPPHYLQPRSHCHFQLVAAGGDFIRGETQYGNHGYTCGGTRWKWKR